MPPSRMNRIAAEGPLLEKNSRSISEKPSTCTTILLYGMIVSAILMISLFIVMLHIKGVINHQKTLTSTTVAAESTVSTLTALPATESSTVTVTTTTVPTTTTTTEPGTKLNVSATTMPTDTVPTSTTRTPDTTTTSPNGNQKCARRVIGFFYDTPTLHITENQLKKLTHAVLYTVSSTVSGWIELKDSNLTNLLKPIKKLSGDDTKVMISLTEYVLIPFHLRTEKQRKALAGKIVDFLVTAQIDGVDLLWDWATATNRTYNDNYSKFVKVLRQTMLAKNSNLIISLTTDSLSTLFWSREGYNSEIFNNLKEMINNVDFINVFSMDFYDPWDVETGPSAPLYYGVHPRENYTVDYTMQKYVCGLNNPEKLNIAVPFYARIWWNVGDALGPAKSEVFRKSKRSDELPGELFTSRKQAEEAGINLLEASWDEATKSSYVLNKNEKWIAMFEDKKSVEAKLDYVNAKSLGGVWIRSVDMDNGSVNLLDSIDFGGYCASESDNAVKYQC
ncbi:hypothetical protein B9Z55_021006 [Caenorhabditis nigoni]|uniref:GH18 domain-containing protein n=1 Tax=Caenorhabditis nigoni TaxID=1611254 RepID=A0A2G5TQA7_9PELO|nr:hypothetical protein B9Z55_021006 [Caenorhabditis nigoni]